uniref:Bm13442 n=1 Tax=Brugia malayi TaxID=6279 RepID=A0A1I9G1U4_BRUMA|nr:Bm13442 [Brugia malayi]
MSSIFHLPVSDTVDKDETKETTSRCVRPETVGNFVRISIYVNIVSESSDRFTSKKFVKTLYYQSIKGNSCIKRQDAVINMWSNDGKLEELISNAVES